MVLLRQAGHSAGLKVALLCLDGQVAAEVKVALVILIDVAQKPRPSVDCTPSVVDRPVPETGSVLSAFLFL